MKLNAVLPISFNDKRIYKLRSKEGMAGLGFLMCLYEIAFENEGEIAIADLDAVAMQIGMPEKKLRVFLELLAELNIFIRTKTGFLQEDIKKNKLKLEKQRLEWREKKKVKYNQQSTKNFQGEVPMESTLHINSLVSKDLINTEDRTEDLNISSPIVGGEHPSNKTLYSPVNLNRAELFSEADREACGTSQEPQGIRTTAVLASQMEEAEKKLGPNSLLAAYERVRKNASQWPFTGETITEPLSYKETTKTPREPQEAKFNANPIVPLGADATEELRAAESRLMPWTKDCTWQFDNRFVVLGQRPMKDYPNVWLTRDSLADVIRVYQASDIPVSKYREMFLKAQDRAAQGTVNGRSGKQIPFYSWLTGWIRDETLENLVKENRLKNLKQQSAGGRH